MSGQNVKKHHKTRIENCKGSLLDKKENYKKWAYWCPNNWPNGWLSKPCNCKRITP